MPRVVDLGLFYLVGRVRQILSINSCIRLSTKSSCNELIVDIILVLIKVHNHKCRVMYVIYYTGIGAKTVPDNDPVGRELVNPRAVRRHNDPMDLVELAHTVQQADNFVRATTGGKLQVIVDQIRFLQMQVKMLFHNNNMVD